MANPTLETTDIASRRKTLSCENFESLRNKPSGEDLFVHDLRTPKSPNSNNSLGRSVLWNPNQKSPFDKAVETLETVKGSIKLHSLASIKLFIRIRREDLADEEQEALDPAVCSLIEKLNDAGRYSDALELLNVSSSRAYEASENRYQYVVSPALREEILRAIDLKLREEGVNSLKMRSLALIKLFIRTRREYLADEEQEGFDLEVCSLIKALNDAGRYLDALELLNVSSSRAYGVPANRYRYVVSPELREKTLDAMDLNLREKELSSIYRDLRNASINEMYEYFRQNNILEESENSLACLTDPTTQALLEKVLEEEA